ncbi:hypothetical protein J3R30DRAFT_3420181 [Lentinula aciculospora]|uniref:Uncharacterized protein n=1 Tax=Lentinula aciculospora TaxID=153920 RepID=A0A9W9DWW6_9AGAR|nr:hypothetical protein J3R30DRAFT_3420181 [Lentinula aciculospora]
MTIFFSLTDAKGTTNSTHHIHTLRHDSPGHIEQRLSDDLAQEETYSSSSTNQLCNDIPSYNGGLNRDYNRERELPPRPESRMDFVSGSPSKPSANVPDDVEQETQARSHKRTPSATFRWTHDILKKIRLTGSTFTSSSDYEPPPFPNAPAAVEPSIAGTPTYNGSIADDCLNITSALTLMPSSSDSSSLSTSSSSYPALDNISISLSSSSDFDDSCEDTDEDSDPDLDSFKEIDISDGLTGEVGNAEYVATVKREQLSHVHTYSPVPASPSISQSAVSYTYPANRSHTQSILESFPTDDDDSDQSMGDYAPKLRTKYTCLPSPLSLFSPIIPPTFSQSDIIPHFPLQSVFQPQRHFYTDRGHSRHALHYRKWFWALREEDWARYTEWLEEYQSQQEAYAGMSTSPELIDSHEKQSSEEDGRCSPVVQGWQPEPGCSSVVQGWQPEPREDDQFKLFPSLFASARESVPNNCRQQTESSGSVLEDIVPSSLPPLTIHPRWGDLIKLKLATAYSSACTETWCMHTDRYLLVGMGLSLWTIRKVLWLSELNRIYAINRSREAREEGEGDKTFVGECNDLDSALISETYSTSDDNESLSEEDDDSEEGKVMYSSVVSLASLISTTASSDDSDATLVESDSDSESPTNAPSMSTLAPQAETHRSGRSVDFDKTCTSSCDDFAGEGEDFEEVDIGLDYGSLNVACTSNMSGSSKIATDSCFLESESLTLLRTLYLDTPIVSSTLVDTKGKCGPNTQNSPFGMASMTKRSWYEECELLLQLTGARDTMV